jgi:hypothetical protein
MKERLFAVWRIAALCGDAALDLSPAKIAEAKDFLKDADAPAEWLESLEKPLEEESAESGADVLGDSLPLGLKLLK